MTRHRLTTDKNESINRAFSASLPKNVKFSRNAHGRVCSVIYRVNYLAGNSVLRKWENVQCPITKGGQVARAVKKNIPASDGIPKKIQTSIIGASAYPSCQVKANAELL